MILDIAYHSIEYNGHMIVIKILLFATILLPQTCDTRQAAVTD